MLSAHELSNMRGVLADSLPDLCDIERPTNSPDGYGGITNGWTTVHSDLPCRVGPAEADRGFVGIVGGSASSIAEWMVTVPANTDVRASDRVVVGSRVFDVRIVVDRSWELSLRMYCSEVS